MRGTVIRRFRRALPTLLPGVLSTAAVAAIAFVLSWADAFGHWARYDDEGYVLATFRSFAERGHLYTRTYSQYGPLPAVLWWAVLRPFGYAFADLTLGRILALALASAGVALAFATGRRWAGPACGALAAVVALADLRVDFAEPWHPGALVGTLVLFALWTTTWSSTRRATVAQGAAIAALALTKVNVGAFAALAWVAALALRHVPRARRPRVARGVIGAAITVIVLGLVGSDLDEPNTRLLALAVVATVVLTLVAEATRPRHAPRTSNGLERAVRSDLADLMLGALAVAVPVLAVTFARGTSLGELVDGVLLAPTRQRDALFIAAPLGGSAWLQLAASVAATAWILATGSARLRAFGALVGGLLLTVSAAGAPFLTHDPLLAAGRRIPFAPFAALLLVVGGDGERDADRRRALFPVLLGALQLLHAYPVAGSQVGWAALVDGTIGAALVVRSWHAVRRHGEERGAPAATRPLLPTALVAVACVVLATAGIRSFRADWSTYRSGTTLDRAHARFVRLPAEQAAELRSVARVLHDECAGYYARPGLWSFAVLSGVFPPTGRVATRWDRLFDAAEQDRVVAELRRHQDGLCLLVDREPFFPPSGDGPLGRYLATFTAPVAEIGPYRVTRLPGRAA